MGADSGDLLKFMICARKRADDTHDNYFYNWGCIHVALMITTPVCMRVFKRYVQNYRVLEATDSDAFFPLSSDQWDNMADHWLATDDDLRACISEESYLERLRNHVFGDKGFQLLLTSGRVMWEAQGFRSGGIKLIHWLKRRDDVAFEDFNRIWKDEYGPRLIEALHAIGGVRKYVQNPQLQMDRALFEGTLFHHAGVGGYAGVEEIWFDDFAALKSATSNPELRELVFKEVSAFADVDGCFSMVMMERVPFDFWTPDEMSPRPGLDNPDGLERHVLAQGYGGWHQPV